MNDVIQQTTTDILQICQPKKIILFAEKRTMATGKLKALSLCIIVADEVNCRDLRTKLHLAISVDIPINLNVYTSEEWEDLCDDSTSYAAWIARKGQVVYESTT